VNTAAPRAWRINVDNTGLLNIGDITGGTTPLSIGTTGTVTVGGGTGKINVGTVDPIYNINGEKFATYAAWMTGQKEETTGILKLSNLVTSNYSITQLPTYYSEIDFGKAEKGSDLWLFSRTTDFGKDWSGLVALLTPNFEGRVWYEKDSASKKLTIYASPITNYPITQLPNYEVSYRLTAPRFDHEKWTNFSQDDASGLQVTNPQF